LIASAVTVLALSLAPTRATPESFADPARIGPYAVGFTSFVVNDPSRQTEVGDRPIPVYVWYPVDRHSIRESTPEAIYRLDPIRGPETTEPVTTPETAPLPTTTSSQWEAFGIDRAYQEPRTSSRKPFPLVMYSPGLTDAAWVDFYLLARLASHGFVVAATTHYGEAALWWDPPFGHLATAAVERPRDVSFALTRILERNLAHGDLLHGLIRPDRIAASGHSYGGYAAMTLAGGDDLVCDVFQTPLLSEWFGVPPEESCVASPADPRIKAIVDLDGSAWVLWWRELHRVHVPSLILGEDWDTVQVDNIRPHAAFSGFPNLRVDVLHSAHRPSFSGYCETTRFLGQLGFLRPETVDEWLASGECDVPQQIARDVAHGLITKYMVAFLKANLAGDARYAPLLVPAVANGQEPNLGFVASERPGLGVPREERDCTFGYFPQARSKERLQADKEYWVSCP
jgi:predicted dienelactone hydrolase